MSEKITDECLLMERPHSDGAELALMGLSDRWLGVQRIYRLPNGYGLSAVNPKALRSYPFAWEIAVITHVEDDGNFASLTYDTPLTNDVEVFQTVGEANAFIRKAIKWASKQEGEAK